MHRQALPRRKVRFEYVQTVGVDYGVKPVDVDGTMVRVNFWDLSGHAAFLEVQERVLQGHKSATLLVYDASDRNSFEELETWLREALEMARGRIRQCASARTK